jgi:hypothetical protein
MYSRALKTAKGTYYRRFGEEYKLAAKFDKTIIGDIIVRKLERHDCRFLKLMPRFIKMKMNHHYHRRRYQHPFIFKRMIMIMILLISPTTIIAI